MIGLINHQSVRSIIHQGKTFVLKRCLMLKLIFKRLLEAIPTLFVLVTISFFHDALGARQSVHQRARLSA